MMEMETALWIYGGGVPAWCLLMSATDEQVDWAYLGSALIWPVMAIHVAGRLIRLALR